MIRVAARRVRYALVLGQRVGGVNFRFGVCHRRCPAVLALRWMLGLFPEQRR